VGANILVMALLVMVTGFALKLLTDEAWVRKDEEAVVAAQSLYATAGMLRAEVEQGYTVPTALTPISAAPLPAWYTLPADASFFLLKHDGHDYLVARFASEGAAGRVYRHAERIMPGAPFKVSGGQLRRTSVSAGTRPAPAGVAPSDVIVKVDGRE